jgi:uncharacterized protein YrrD
MPHDLKSLMGFSVIASDGEVGSVKNFLFDDVSWTIHYLVVEVGTWLKRREVVLPIAAVDRPDWAKKTFQAHLTKEQVGNSPNTDTEKPVSRQQEIAMEVSLLGVHPVLGRSSNSDRKEVPGSYQRGS